MKNNEMSEFAYKEVKDIKEKKQFQKEFRSLARSFPSIVQKNGLGTAIAYINSKKGSEHEKLYEIINAWMLRKWKTNELLESIVSTQSIEYRIYTDEVMRLCVWIKRFAEGIIENE